MSLTGKGDKLEPRVRRVSHSKAVCTPQGRNCWKEPNIESNKEGFAPDYILSHMKTTWESQSSPGVECSILWRWSEMPFVHRYRCVVDLLSACLIPMVSEQPASQMSFYEVVSVS